MYNLMITRYAFIRSISRCDDSATTRPVGRWSDVLHAFAVAQFLRVRFEVKLGALLRVVDHVAIGDAQGV